MILVEADVLIQSGLDGAIGEAVYDGDSFVELGLCYIASSVLSIFLGLLQFLLALVGRYTPCTAHDMDKPNAHLLSVVVICLFRRRGCGNRWQWERR